MIFFRKIIYYATFLLFLWAAVDILISCEIPGLPSCCTIKMSREASVFSALVILFGAYQLYIYSESPKEKSKNETTPIPSLNLDPIPPTDQEWIAEIKTRKQKGEKLNAYSKDGAIAARRKARVLGVEECFVEFLSEEEVRERRGW